MFNDYDHFDARIDIQNSWQDARLGIRRFIPGRLWALCLEVL